MKKKTLLFVFLIGIMTANCFAQEYVTEPKAIEYSEIIDTANYPLYVSDLTLKNVFEKRESELIGKYASLTSMVLQKYVSPDDLENCDYEATKNMFMRQQGKLFDYNIADGTDTYCDDFRGIKHISGSFFYNITDNLFNGCVLNIKKTIRHQLSQNKDFRDALFDKTCDFICDLTMLFPKDFKSDIISKMNEILNILNDIPTHKYEVSYNKSCPYFKVDGVKNYEIGYSKAGWILRRIYIDKIPYEEIKHKTEELLARVQGIDNSNNADVAYIYKITKGILYCVGRVNYLYSSALGCKYYVNDGIIEKIVEDGIPFFSVTSSEYISDSDDQYRKMGFFNKNTILKLDEDGNFVNVNVEYGK